MSAKTQKVLPEKEFEEWMPYIYRAAAEVSAKYRNCSAKLVPAKKRKEGGGARERQDADAAV